MIHTVSTIDPNVLMREKLERLICEKTAGAIRGLRVDCRDNQILLTGQFVDSGSIVGTTKSC